MHEFVEIVTTMKSAAQRQKEYRERKKMKEQLQGLKKPPKTNAQHQQKYRNKQKETQTEASKLTRRKNNAASAKRYRERLNLKKQLDKLNSQSSLINDSLPIVPIGDKIETVECQKHDECSMPNVFLYHDTSIPGDGNCLFASLIKILNLQISASVLRHRLLISPHLIACQNPTRARKILRSESGYGDLNCLYIFSGLYNQNICVHYHTLDNNTDGVDVGFFYFKINDSMNFIHLHLRNTHFTPYVVVERMIPEENEDFPLELSDSINMKIEQKQSLLGSEESMGMEMKLDVDDMPPQESFRKDMEQPVVIKEEVKLEDALLFEENNFIGSNKIESDMLTERDLFEESKTAQKDDGATEEVISQNASDCPKEQVIMKLETEEISTLKNGECSSGNYEQSKVVKEKIKIEDSQLLDVGTNMWDTYEELESSEEKNCTRNGTESVINIETTSRCGSSKRIQCQFCDYTARYPYIMREHTDAVHFGFKSFRCALCDYSAIQLSRLKDHINAVHRKLRMHKCEHCDFVATLASNLRIHIKAVHSKIKDHKCGHCDYAASRPATLRNHMNAVHLKIGKPKRHKCEHCDFVTSEAIKVRYHIEAVHKKIRNHKCEQCKFASYSTDALKQHVKAVHSKIRDHKCEQCDYAASRPSQLKEHVDGFHLKRKDHKCEYCDYATSRPSLLKIHIDAVHLKLKRYKCEQCEYSANTATKLRYHIQAVHEKKRDHKCGQCKFSSFSADKLRLHIKAVHSKIKDHKCEYCNYATAISSELNKHINAKHRKIGHR